MNRLARTTAAVLTAAAVAVSTAGCADISTVGTIEGENIAAGVYIRYVMQAISEADNEIDQQLSEAGQSASDIENFSYLNYNVQEKPYKEYVKDRAIELTKQHIAVQKRFEELGLELTDTEVSTEKEEIADMWNSEMNYYGYSLGITYGDYYKNMGISRSSYQEVELNSMMSNKLFDKYYDENGITATDENDIKTYFNDNYGRFQIIEVSLTEGDGSAIETDEGKAEMEKMANDYVDRIKGGEDFETVYHEYEDYVAEQKEQAEKDEDTSSDDESSDDTSSDESSEDNSSDESSDSSSMTRSADTASDESSDDTSSDDSSEDTSSDDTSSDDSSEDTSSDDTSSDDSSEDNSSDTEEEEEDHETLLSKESTSPSEEFVEWAFKLGEDEGGVYKDETVYYAVVRRPLLDREDWYDNARSDILHLMKDEDFEKLLNEAAANFNVQLNDSAISAYDAQTVIDKQAKAMG